MQKDRDKEDSVKAILSSLKLHLLLKSDMLLSISEPIRSANNHGFKYSLTLHCCEDEVIHSFKHSNIH